MLLCVDMTQSESYELRENGDGSREEKKPVKSVGGAIIGFTQYTDPILLAIHFSIAAIQSLWRVCLVGVKCPYHLGKHDMVWDSDLMVVARSGWEYTDIRW